MNKYKEALDQKLKEKDIKCPHCGCEDIGIDNWNIFDGEGDWFYYCKECDGVF